MATFYKKPIYDITVFYIDGWEVLIHKTEPLTLIKALKYTRIYLEMDIVNCVRIERNGRPIATFYREVLKLYKEKEL
ncbi:hypothetical protein HIU56_12305 [Enterococcus faecium]|uniref:hypothetical protein n=1 Tax=Enterococcus faecium TaxID=1352 RepID=UPI001C44D5A8|nr:hypothetical protein [Enterococcus faecium]